jgi:hypothetical protein
MWLLGILLFFAAGPIVNIWLYIRKENRLLEQDDWEHPVPADDELIIVEQPHPVTGEIAGRIQMTWIQLIDFWTDLPWALKKKQLERVQYKDCEWGIMADGTEGWIQKAGKSAAAKEAIKSAANTANNEKAKRHLRGQIERQKRRNNGQKR